jgi:hypothetical protein
MNSGKWHDAKAYRLPARPSLNVGGFIARGFCCFSESCRNRLGGDTAFATPPLVPECGHDARSPTVTPLSVLPLY